MPTLVRNMPKRLKPTTKRKSIEKIWLNRTQKFIQNDVKLYNKNLASLTLTSNKTVNSNSWQSIDYTNSDSTSRDRNKNSWWYELDLTTRYWARQRPVTIESLRIAWNLYFEVAVPIYFSETQNRSSNTNDNPKTFEIVQNLLVAVIDNWKLCHERALFSEDSDALHFGFDAVWNQLQALREIPNVRAFTMVIGGLSSITDCFSNTSSLKEPTLNPIDVIRYMMSSKHHYQHPNIFTWNAALTVWAKRARFASTKSNVHNIYLDSATKAHDILKLMVSCNHPPDAFSLANVLDAYASSMNNKSHQTLEQQQKLDSFCDQAQALFHQYSDICSSNTVCCLHLLRLYCKSNLENGVLLAYSLLKRMIDSYLNFLTEELPHNSRSKDSPPKPSYSCFSVVMSGLANRGDDELVDLLLRQQQNLYELSHYDSCFKPSITTLSTITNAYARSHRPELAERLLKRVFESFGNYYDKDRTDGENNVISDGMTRSQVSKSRDQAEQLNVLVPDTTFVNTCIHAWAESDRENAPEKAEYLLMHYLRNNKLSSGNPKKMLSPDSYSYTTVMKAWCRSNRTDAAEQCQRLLQWMWNDHYSSMVSSRRSTEKSLAAVTNKGAGSSIPTTIENNEVKPDHVTYSTVMFSWYRAAVNGHPLAPEKAQELYHDMLKHGIRPTQNIYIWLIRTWSQATNKHSTEVSQKVWWCFDQMVCRYHAGEESLRPGAKIYNALMDSLKRRGDGEGADVLLQKMLDECLVNKNRAAQPNRLVFHNLMAAWANSKAPSAPKRVESILVQMKVLADSHNWDCRPDKVTLTILMDSWAKSGHADAPEHVEMILKEMNTRSDAGEKSFQPTTYCYAIVLNAWSRSSVSSAPIRSQAIFDDMLERYESKQDVSLQPTLFEFTALLTTWAKSSHPAALQKCLAILNDMESRQSHHNKNDCQPKSYHFAMVINLCAHLGDFTNAERLLYRIRSDSSDRLTIQSCLNTILKAYENSDAIDAAMKAQNLLYEIKKVHAINPHVSAYLSCIKCWEIRSAKDSNSYSRAKALLVDLTMEQRLSAASNQNESILNFSEALRSSLLIALSNCYHDNLAYQAEEKTEIERLIRSMK